jgi:hypothetical protein
MPRPYLYLIYHCRHALATTSDPMRWRGSSTEHLCWRRSAVRWAWGRTGPFCSAPATTPSPSEPGPPLHLRPLGRYSFGARGTTAIRAGALEPSVNGLIDTTFGCYPSSKAADAMPKGAPSVGTHAQHATLLMPLKCCNFRPTGPFGITLRDGCVMDGAVGVITHCHWLTRTIYGTGWRMTSCWTCGSWDFSCSVRDKVRENLRQRAEVPAAAAEVSTWCSQIHQTILVDLDEGSWTRRLTVSTWVFDQDRK